MFNFRNKKFPFFHQHDEMDCGPSCLKMICEYYGKKFSIDYLREISFLTREGVSLLSVNEAAEKLGFNTLMLKLTYKGLAEIDFPCIVHWNQNHFLVVIEINRKTNKIKIADPNSGILSITKEVFLQNWISSSNNKGVALVLEPTNDFYEKAEINQKSKKYSFLFNYLKPHKKLFGQLFLSLALLSLVSFIFPFLTQILIDLGVKYKNYQVVTLILVSQLFLFIGITTIELIRNWITLHINARVSLRIISDFLGKLLKLPLSFFDSKAVGDLSQRLNDHHRIESFLTDVILNSAFSIFSIIIFIFILSAYSMKILAIFLIASLLGILWVLIFQKKRKQLDYIRFQRNKENQDKLFELIIGMQEIKLNGGETYKRWEWERLQIKLFKLNIQSLTLEQYQKTGFTFFNNVKNIIISYLAAIETINGNLSLGAMLSISFIIGQTNGPLEHLVSFFKAAQDAKISLDRLLEVQDKKGEEEIIDPASLIRMGDEYLTAENIHVSDLSFQYEGPHSPYILKNVNFVIPKGKITAIVGESGSGKTTLMKILLGFYNPVKGKVEIGDKDLKYILPKNWRDKCGTVLQDGFIFTDTIARNIVSNGHDIDEDKLDNAISVANLDETVNDFPLKYTTKIGNSGIGLSGGQKQRILIARAVYKDPKYLFLDEATSSLDARNEKIIMENLNNFFIGRTVVIIAHRLSTVKNADQIIVMKKGAIVEIGNHQDLITRQGDYYSLVKNQLEL